MSDDTEEVHIDADFTKWNEAWGTGNKPGSEPTEHAIAERVPCKNDLYAERGACIAIPECCNCLGDGTRWVITDKRIEQRFTVGGIEETVVLDGGWWREVTP